MKLTFSDVLKGILTFLERFYNSILYNGFYIVLSFIFPFMIYKMEAGHEIIENILDGHTGLNISALMFAFFILAFSVWCVPTIAIYIWKFFTGNKTRKSTLYKYLTVIYSDAGNSDASCTNTKIIPHLQIPIKYFAVLPWMVFIFTCVYIFFHNWCYTVLAALALLGMFVLVNVFIEPIARLYDKWLFRTDKRIFIRYIVFLLVFIFFNSIPWIVDTWSPGIFGDDNRAKVLLIGINFLQLLSFYIFINYLENLPQKMDADTRYTISHFNYIFVTSISLIIVAVLFIMNWNSNISILNPIFIVVSCIAIFIMFFDVFFTSQLLLTHIATEIRPACPKKQECGISECSKNEILHWYRLAINFCILGFIYLTFFNSVNNHNIREVESDAGPAITDTRKSMDVYFKNWLAQNHGITADGSDKDLTIYLVSGPGGGSRAATWFYLTMKELDSIYGDKFYKNVFSISTVSGSTSGANMYLAEKHLNFPNKPGSAQLARDIYSKNYFSSTFFGLLIGDGVEGTLGRFTKQTRNRNYYFQKEEMNAFIKAYNAQGKDRERVRRYFENDMMYAYQNQSFPLFFINTTIIDFGKRGIFSPVRLDDVSIGVDLYGRYAAGKNRHGLPMVTCVNQSQAFPLINSYDYLEGTGRFCDGGLYDNSGCSTTLEIYQALRKYIKIHKFKNIEIVCLNILNGDIRNDFEAHASPSSILNTITGIASLPFSGNEAYAFFNLERQIKNHNFNYSTNEDPTSDDKVITLKPSNKYNLTRMLSSKAIDSIYKDVKRQVKAKEREFDNVKIAKVADSLPVSAAK
jgi:hypothetical protein